MSIVDNLFVWGNNDTFQLSATLGSASLIRVSLICFFAAVFIIPAELLHEKNNNFHHR